MSLYPLLPVAAATLGSLAARVADRVSDGVAFAELLGPILPDRSHPAHATAGTEQAESAEVQATSSGVEAIRSATEKALAEFQRIALERLAAAGVDWTRPIRLRSDRFGKVVVEGDHPDRATIERVFEEDAALSALFNYVSANYRALYARSKDPAAALPLDAGPQRGGSARGSDHVDANTFRLVLDGHRLRVEW